MVSGLRESLPLLKHCICTAELKAVAGLSDLVGADSGLAGVAIDVDDADLA